jgi:dolichol-phosphate mannosyltransferase
LPRFLEAIDTGRRPGTRLALGAGRRDCQLEFRRQLIGRGGSFYARTIPGAPVRDLTGGIKCFRREVLEALDLSTVRVSGYAFQIELTYRALRRGLVREIPIGFEDRQVGMSKMPRAIFPEAVTTVWKLRTSGGR